MHPGSIKCTQHTHFQTPHYRVHIIFSKPHIAMKMINIRLKCSMHMESTLCVALDLYPLPTCVLNTCENNNIFGWPPSTL